ncbi:MAG: ATP-binding cassette domain-containing protein [candidate division SR1 bacterium]|nr:ATP-binding cassette domain-containing protein [candidate division SR1 bacterium]
MHNSIEVKDLRKIFKLEIKKQGFRNRIKAIFRPEFKESEAVASINFSVKKGEKIAFLGPNGAGKSTTIKMLTGILHPTSGHINVLGLDPATQRNKLVYKIGAVFGQTSRLRYHLTAIDTFKLMGKLFDIPNKQLEKRLDYLVDKFEIRHMINNPVRKLSLGQRMRCEIVSSLIHSPEIIFLDEPTIGLDMIAKQKLRETINEIHDLEGTTIFLTSHDLGDIEQVCDRVIIINHGKICYDGSIVDLRKQYIKKKIIKVKIANSSEFKALDFMNIIKKELDYIEFEIPNTKENLQKTFETITGNYDVDDIEIKDPTIEEIIKEFY